MSKQKKVTDDQIKEMRELRSSGMTNKEIGFRLDLHEATVSGYVKDIKTDNRRRRLNAIVDPVKDLYPCIPKKNHRVNRG